MTAATPLEQSPTFMGNTRSQLRKRTLLFRYLTIINLTLGAWYLIWRTTQSVNWEVWWLSVPLLCAEIYGYFGGVLFLTGLWRPIVRQVKPLSQLMPKMVKSEWPNIDIFITCYNEPTDMVQETVRAALAMDYPVTKLKVYVLDDGNDPNMRAMAERVCIEDLQNPALQQHSKALQLERENMRVKQADLEAALQALESCEADNPEGCSPQQQLIQKAVTLLGPKEESLSQKLTNAIKDLTKSIHKHEMDLSDLSRCRYIARPKPKGRPHHAKAGNINYAIFSGKTKGDFILTLDADHIPKPHFLQRVLPYFFEYNLRQGRYESNSIAFVQTPQSFYNLPSDDPYGHGASLFYGPIQQGKDGLNSAFYTGTNAILRREALVTVGLKNFSQMLEEDQSRLNEFELIGGLSSASITEDMNSAMRLHASGWRSAYHDEVLAEGLAPDDLSSTLKQRLRWAQGTLQVFRTENPLLKPGLSFWQRLQYFQTMYSYFSGFATLIFLVCPLAYFFSGVIPVSAYSTDFVIHFVPVYIINRVTFIVLAWGISASEIWRCEQYAVALFPLFIEAVMSVLVNTSLTFQVTPKERQSGIYLNLVWPQLMMFCLLILGILWAGIQLALGNLDNPLTYWVNVAWSLYSLSLLWSVIRASFWSPPETNTQDLQQPTNLGSAQT